MKKHSLKLFIDLFFWILATPIAYFLRLEIPFLQYLPDILWATVAMLPVKAYLIYVFGFNRQSWHKVGVLDVSTLLKGTVLSMAVFLGLAMLFRGELFIPYSVPIIESIVAFLALNCIRFSTRLFDEQRRRETVKTTKTKRILIAGAGEAGTMMAREILRHPESKMEPIGFLDDDPQKQSQNFLGLPVYGPLANLPEVAKRKDVDEVLIAMPSASGKVIRKVVEKAREVNLDHKIIPALHKLIEGDPNLSQIRDVDVEDLLKREAVVLENQEIAGYLQNQTVLITGAGGSIGSEIVRQVLKFSPDKLLLVDHSEYNMYMIDQELTRAETSIEYRTIIADIRDYDVLESIMEEHNPDVIFHAAAHKHVPLMEYNPEQAILNNVGGTRNLVELALNYGVKRFVNISTDKAVNPTSVMGVSKRIAEEVVEWGSNRCRENQVFVSVRFGNVLGSRGSVIPKFKEQIKRGDPITVTHPDMTRYFMTIPEASQLVLQAGSQAKNGCVYVLDMGEPVKIVDMARDLIKLSGLEPEEDIQIIFTGIRPGEKLYEELLTSEEGTCATKHEKIFVARKNGLKIYNFDEKLDQLFNIAYTGNKEQIKGMFKKLVPSYKYEPESRNQVEQALVE